MLGCEGFVITAASPALHGVWSHTCVSLTGQTRLDSRRNGLFALSHIFACTFQVIWSQKLQAANFGSTYHGSRRGIPITLLEQTFVVFDILADTI